MIADLGKISTYAEYEKIAAQLADIDIAMLFLNVVMRMMKMGTTRR